MSRILRIKDVIKKTGLSKSTMYMEIERGHFPKPVQLTRRSVGWLESEVEQWVASRLPVGEKNSSVDIEAGESQ